MSKSFLFITRAQPFHKGHLENIKTIFSAMDKGDVLLVCIGSDEQHNDMRNPLKGKFRSDIAWDAINKERLLFFEKKSFFPDVWMVRLPDSPYNYDLWVANAQRIFATQYKRLGFKIFSPDTIVCGQDGVEQYAKDFGASVWKLPTVKIDGLEIHASTIREMIVAGEDRSVIAKYLPETIKPKQLDYIINTIKKQAKISEDYANDTNCKYNSCFMAVDNLVQDGGRVLFIRRKDNGKLAFPGGFAEPKEDLMKNAIRELKEETGIDIGQNSSFILKSAKVFDCPYRGPRASGRVNVLTTVHHWKTLPGITLDDSKIVAGDDAAAIEWLSLADIENTSADKFHGDHKKIVCNILGLDYFWRT